MKTLVIGLLALAMGGCAGGALSIGLGAAGEFYALMCGSPTCGVPWQSRPVCPAGVDPKAVTWCRIVPAEAVGASASEKSCMHERGYSQEEN